MKYVIKVISPTYYFLKLLKNLCYVSGCPLFIGHCCFRCFLQTLQPPFASFTHSLSSSHRTFAHAVPTPFVLYPVNPYSSFGSLFKPHFLKENISDPLVLVQLSYYLLLCHYEAFLSSIYHSGNFTAVYLLITPSSTQLSC